MEDRNPSPPPEFDKDIDLYKADSVGGTAISKHWVLKTLMEIINEVEKHAENKEDDAVEVSDDLEDSSCKLWDICMDKEIAVYLLEFDIIEILYGVILKSKSPRLTEISVGILGNMACSDVACLEISKLDHLSLFSLKTFGEIVTSYYALLIVYENQLCNIPVVGNHQSVEASPDTPTLLEAVRLVKTCVSIDSCCRFWLYSIVNGIDDFASYSQFILSSSTNGKLLNVLSEVIDLLCEKSNGVLESCCSEEFVGSLLEAASQQCQDDPTSSLPSLCYSLHVLHLISESDKGRPVIENLRRGVGAFLSSLFYQWMTSHPKVEYNRDSRMSSSEVSVSCCLSISSIILNVEEGVQDAEEKSDVTSDETVNENQLNGATKNGEKSKSILKNGAIKNGNAEKRDSVEVKTSTDIDDEDRELIIKFARSVMSAKGIVSALPVVSAINVENESSNEFKTPLHFARNSPRLGTSVSSLLSKTSDSGPSVETLVQTPEIHSHSSSETPPPKDNDSAFTPTTREHSEAEKKSHEPVPAAVLCDLANQVLKTATQHGWIPAVLTTDSPRKILV